MNVDVRIVPVTEEDGPKVERFLRKYFFPDEPLNSSLQRCPEDIPFLKVLSNRKSFKAVNVLENSEDSLLGVAINDEVSLSERQQPSPNACPKYLKIKKILRELDDRSRIWERVNNENHFNIICVAVNSNYRGLGLGKKLVSESLNLAKRLGYRFASIECSSFYSAKFAVEMGFELLGEIPYDEYLDDSGSQVFKVSPPHKAIKKLMKRL